MKVVGAVFGYSYLECCSYPLKFIVSVMAAAGSSATSPLSCLICGAKFCRRRHLRNHVHDFHDLMETRFMDGFMPEFKECEFCRACNQGNSLPNSLAANSSPSDALC